MTHPIQTPSPVSPLTSHLSRLTSHVSRLTSYVLPLTILLFPTLAFALTGHVINHTLDRPEANIPVTYIHHAEGDVTIVRDTTDQTGRFTLDVPTEPSGDPPPMLIARYNNIDYPGNPAPNGNTVEIPVYETTDQDTALSIATHHVLVNLNTKQVTYILIVKNSGDHTYLTGGSHGHGLELPLPNGVTEILRAPEGVHLHGSVLVDPRPIIPGQSQSFFTFSLPPNNQLNQTITYQTDTFDLLVQPPEAQVSTTGLHDHGTVDFGGQTFRQFATANVTPGAKIGMQFGSNNTTTDPDHNLWIGIGIFIAIGLIASIFFMLRNPNPPPTSHTPTSSNRRQALLEQIADLDNRYENGHLTKEIYETRRDVLKAEVAELSENRQALLEQIADLDEQYEKGNLDQQNYQQQRDVLKRRVANLTD